MLAIIKTVNGVKKIIPLTADIGAGNPVGTVIVVCSNQIPSNYLPLGTQYDTSLYPVLYALLGTDTTPTASALGLPTLTSGQYAIKATSGLPENQQDNVVATINASNSYSTEEVNTGKKWIDGKPIYRKTINIGTLPNNTTKSVSLGIVMASLVSVQGYAHRTLDGLIIPIPFVNPSLLNQNVAVTFPLVNGVTNIRVLTASDLTVYETCYITVEYTKTTD